jgi:hypothetical protein
MLKRSAVCACLALSFALAATAQGAQDPDRVQERLKSVTQEKYAGADAVIVSDETKVEVEESGLSHVNKTQLIKVLTEAGAAKYATMRFDYDPASSFAEVKKITIYRASGAVEEVPQSRILDLPQPQFMIYWGPRMKVASIPKLNPGDAVRIQTYSKGFVIAYLGNGGDDSKYIPPMYGHYYDVVLFQADYPIVRKTYTIVLPKDKPLRAQVFHGEVASLCSFDDKSLTYTWWKENVPAIEREPRMVEDTDAMPKLVLATVPNWEEKSRWFFHVNEDVNTFAYNDAIKAKVAQITGGLKTDDDKRLAILAWVARQIRYSGISMGKGEGYTLHPGIMDFNDRAGVCKDIAGMCITMFRAAGFDHTYPAMTMAGARVEDIPADQFNHCVVATEVAPNQYKLYDPTWCPFSREIWSSAEKPQNYVIGSPRGEVLMETPDAPASDNFVKVVGESRLDEEGDMEGTFTITAGNYSETNLVWTVVNSPASEVRAAFEHFLERVSPSAELLSLQTSDPIDVTKPFKIVLKYRVPGYAMVYGGSLAFTPPLARNILEGRRLTDFVAAVKGESRKYDIFLRATRLFDYQDTVFLPKGFSSLKAAPEYAKVDGPAAAFSAGVSVSPGKLVYSEQITIKKKIVPASEYAGLKETVEAASDAAGGLVVVSR